MGLERDFQPKLIRELRNRFPGCVIIKNDPTYIQGMPDLLILYENKWAMLEVKKSSRASHQPNQDFYIDKLNQMSFAAFIFPENYEEVLDGLQQTFES